MTSLINRRLIKSSHTLSADLANGEAVLMDIDSGSYFGFEGVASHIWKLFDEPAMVDDVIQQLSRSYHISPEVCKAESLDFIGELIEKGLLTELE
jgi:hypothetical protein